MSHLVILPSSNLSASDSGAADVEAAAGASSDELDCDNETANEVKSLWKYCAKVTIR